MDSLSMGSFSSNIGDSIDFEEPELTLSDKLKPFKSSNFEPEAYVSTKCQSTSEKEIKHLSAYLVDLKKASAEEMRRSVYANYPAFIRTSREISDLEGQLLSLRNLLSTWGANVHSLAEGVRIDSLSGGPDRSIEDNDLDFEEREPSKIEKWLSQFMEKLEVLMAERRVNEALNALDEGEQIAQEAYNRQTMTSAAFFSLQNTITEQRQKLADQLAEAACQPSTSGAELRAAVQAVKQLGDGARAHSLLLSAHKYKLQCNVQALHPSGKSYGVAYTAALSQLVFSTIAQAANDSLAGFGDEPAYTSELVTWAVNQTEKFALLVKRHVIASPAAAGGLRTVAECVQICLGHCFLLESRGLALSPVLLKIFRPLVEQALNANLKRIELSTAALAADDDWSLSFTPVGSRSLGTSSSLSNVLASQPKLSSSAHRFNTMVQDLCEDIGPLESLQLANPALEGVMQAFNSYISMLINALPGSTETENLEGSGSRIVRIAETEAQQIALLANALILADEFLPRAATKLLSSQQSSSNEEPPRKASEQRELKKRLQRLVDQLRDSFCRQHALDLIFTEDGSVRLGAHMYLGMDATGEEPEWFPSPIYQELFAKLTRVAIIASDMFVGRERFATILLMRMTETVILWLSDDQSFWEEIEEGPTPLGPFGLQQFYLDMEFVILFASQGRYLSRNLHQVIKNIIGRAIEAVAATERDPYRYLMLCQRELNSVLPNVKSCTLPEDEWFADVAQIAINMLTGKGNVGNVDVTSPTASVSASSAFSHGSN